MVTLSWIADAIGMVACGYLVGRVTSGELYRCPVCRHTGIPDVDRHCKIYHPSLFWPRHDDNSELGRDPRPEEDVANVFHGAVREWIKKNSLPR